ncbi:hypothetical protein CFIMG_008291RA00001 [Ceratocystis fimbriata CBS 114723]|uniref:Uncharacterized protein n=1 Tax=Ceratocystis fimbriata CBS 114723 TaxID=1035309 RepID=A0A2C5WZX6_9PEZI|nr:hypothetical protein CFIMG_008291RA00001 [Ceratocystis fimbriata CBS 114723]
MISHYVPGISSNLTIVLTTSPTPSTPSTDLVASILSSFHTHCPILLQCNIIVVLDTFERISPVLRLKKGQATPELAAAYETYKAKIKALFLRQWPGPNGLCSTGLDRNTLSPHISVDIAEYGSPGQAHTSVALDITEYLAAGVTLIEPRERLGFGLGVRSALRRVTTPYVWVQQHDWALDAPIPVNEIVQVMHANHLCEHAPIRYVCLPSVRMVGYAASMLAVKHTMLRQLTEKLKGNYSQVAVGKEEGVIEEAEERRKAMAGERVSLTPMFFWHDKTHIASTEHYKQRVFPSRLAMPRGAFIEDTIGHRARDQMKAGDFAKWATWLYYPKDGQQLCLRHLDGRMWKGMEAEAVLQKGYMHAKAVTAQKRAEEAERNRKRDGRGDEEISAELLWVGSDI